MQEVGEVSSSAGLHMLLLHTGKGILCLCFSFPNFRTEPTAPFFRKVFIFSNPTDITHEALAMDWNGVLSAFCGGAHLFQHPSKIAWLSFLPHG